MDKLTMAHDYLLKIIPKASLVDDEDIEFTVDTAWKYADAMQAEADKREPSGLPESLRERHDFTKAIAKGIENYEKEKWQPDWSQAPDDATAWEYLGHGAARWHTTTKGMYKAADLFGYSCADMLLLERP